MSTTDHLHAIVAELTRNAQLVDGASLDALADALDDAARTERHVFCAGAGRSGLAIRGFANRLLHLGVDVSVVGEITSPHSQPEDLLLIASGSGETGSLVSLAEKAHGAGVRIALVTMDAASAIAGLADIVVVVPGASPKLRSAARVSTIQPMGSAFEQLTGLVCDALVLEVAGRRGETTETMFPRHADLE